MTKSLPQQVKPLLAQSSTDSLRVWLLAILASGMLHLIGVGIWIYYQRVVIVMQPTPNEAVARDRAGIRFAARAFPIELIAIEAQTPVSAQKPTPETTSVAPSPIPKETPTQAQNSKNSQIPAKSPSPPSQSPKKAISPLSRTNSTPTPNPRPKPQASPNPSPTPQASPNPSPTPTSKPQASPNPSPTPIPKPQASPNPSPTPTPQPNPTPQPQATPQPNPTPKPQASPNPSPTPTPKPQASPNPSPTPIPTPTPLPPLQPSPTTQNYFRVQVGEMRRGWTGDVISQAAQIKQKEKQLERINYLTPLGINLEGVVRLEAVIIIEINGKATVEPQFVEILQGNISPTQAEKLAQAILAQWQFEPAYMEGEPVVQDYVIQLTLSPLNDG